MLGAFGMGAVIGALNIGQIRQRLSGESAIRACALSMGGAIAAVALSRQPVLTAAALVIAGAVWMLAVALFNIGVQLSAPRWVAGRSLAAFQASIAGGIAVGWWPRRCLGCGSACRGSARATKTPKCSKIPRCGCR
jgi:pimeloyl-ACP methyl ester carboxylesterase